jgi:hypothetical protein
VDLGRSQNVCKGSRFTVEGERCLASSLALLKSLDVEEEEEEAGGPGCVGGGSGKAGQDETTIEP